MRKYKSHRTAEEVLQLCALAGVPYDDLDYWTGGETIIVGAQGNGHVVFNFEHGTFTGETPEGMTFASSDTEYDGHAWFEALLNLFFTEPA